MASRVTTHYADGSVAVDQALLTPIITAPDLSSRSQGSRALGTRFLRESRSGLLVTTPQPLFPAGYETTGPIAVKAGSFYRYAFYAGCSKQATASNISVGFSGTATLANVGGINRIRLAGNADTWASTGWTSAAITNGDIQLAASAHAAARFALAGEGVFGVSVSGLIEPYLQFSAVLSSFSVDPGSYFEIWSI